MCEPLAQPDGNTVGDLVNWAVEAAGQYKVCQDKHACMATWAQQQKP